MFIFPEYFRTILEGWTVEKFHPFFSETFYSYVKEISEIYVVFKMCMRN